MLTIELAKGTVARGIACDSGRIYYTTSNSPLVHCLSEKGEALPDAFAAPENIGGMTCRDGIFLLGSYSAPNTLIYETQSDGTVLNVIDYLKGIPPLYLPIEPYTRYVTGITPGRRDSLWISLQNSKFIYNIAKDGSFAAVRQVPLKEDGDPIDIAGICSDGSTMYLTDVTDSKIYCLNMTFGGVKRIPLEDKFEPFGIFWRDDKLYVISANFNKPKILIL